MTRPSPRREQQLSPAGFGWSSIPSLVDASDVDRILDECHVLSLLPPAERRARDRPHGGTTHLDQLDERIPLVAAMTRRPVLVDAVERAYSGAGQLRLDAAAYRSPQPGHGGQALHIDSTPDDADTYVTVIVALCEFTTSNGATRVVPGSQTRPDLWRSTGSRHSHTDELLLTGAAGTAFVLSGGLLHSGTPNRSRSARPALQLIWRAIE